MKQYYDESKKRTALMQIESLSNAFGIEDRLREEIFFLFLSAFQKKITQGLNFKLVIPALIYYISQKENLLLTLQDISVYCGSRERHILKTYKKLLLELKLKPVFRNPEILIEKTAGKLNLSKNTKDRAVSFLGSINNSSPFIKAGIALSRALVLTKECKLEKIAETLSVSKASIAK